MAIRRHSQPHKRERVPDSRVGPGSAGFARGPASAALAGWLAVLTVFLAMCLGLLPAANAAQRPDRQAAPAPAGGASDPQAQPGSVRPEGVASEAAPTGQPEAHQAAAPQGAVPGRAAEDAAAPLHPEGTQQEHGRAEHAQAGDTRAGHGEAGHGEEHAESPWALVARLVNFAILAGTLIYFIRSPFAQHLLARATEIRRDLAQAADARAAAEAQISEVERRLGALPAELEALKRKGEADIAADRARISEAAAAEREALLAQARREMDMKLRMAEQSLVRRTAELAIALARDRMKREIRDDDQARLVERYLNQIARS
ncbi:MAG: hypothetical protein ACE148_13420 [Vicinamibacterales bacterium]